jgi:hypothetical protein
MKIKILAVIMIVLLGAGLAPGVMGAEGSPLGTIKPTNELAQQEVNGGLVKFVNQALAFITGIAAVCLLFRIIWSGIRVIQNAKSPEDFYTHMKKIMWAAIGMIVVALAYALTRWILKAMGLDPEMLNSPVEQLTKT